MKEQNLRLSLIEKWFILTRDKIKKADYRSITPYWCKRLFNHAEGKLTIEEIDRLINNFSYYGYKDIEHFLVYNKLSFKPFTHNIMTLGYPKATDTSRILKLEHKGIEIRTGNPLLGAEPNKLYFVIKHGEIL